MKVGIIIYSHTGNTLSVAQKLEQALAAKGHTVTLARVTAVDENPALPKFDLKDIPQADGYEALIFGAPVHAFSLSRVMRTYLEQIPSLSGKKAAFFVTQQLPFTWMGGSNAIKQMMKICEQKGADLGEMGIVNWASKKREQKQAEVINRLSRL